MIPDDDDDDDDERLVVGLLRLDLLDRWSDVFRHIKIPPHPPKNFYREPATEILKGKLPAGRTKEGKISSKSTSVVTYNTIWVEFAPSNVGRCSAATEIPTAT